MAATVPPEIPVPESEMLSVGFEPLSARVTPPFTNPLDCGANVTANVALCPGASAVGSVNPLRLNPLPVAVAWEIVRLEPPALVRVSEAVRLLPIETLPKPTLDGDAANEPTATPVPARGTVIVLEPFFDPPLLPLPVTAEPDELVSIVTPPLTPPAD